MRPREETLKSAQQKRGLNLKLDKNDKRYTECLNCTFPFMTQKLGTLFCCDECRINYNNEKKREKRFSESKNKISEPFSQVDSQSAFEIKIKTLVEVFEDDYSLGQAVRKLVYK